MLRPAKLQELCALGAQRNFRSFPLKPGDSALINNGQEDLRNLDDCL